MGQGGGDGEGWDGDGWGGDGQGGDGWVGMGRDGDGRDGDGRDRDGRDGDGWGEDGMGAMGMGGEGHATQNPETYICAPDPTHHRALRSPVHLFLTKLPSPPHAALVSLAARFTTAGRTHAGRAASIADERDGAEMRRPGRCLRN